MEKPKIGIVMSTPREGSDFDLLNESAKANLDEFAWRARALKAGREEAAESFGARR
jgi:hypothetical protein